jgi:hypothetical protein
MCKEAFIATITGVTMFEFYVGVFVIIILLYYTSVYLSKRVYTAFLEWLTSGMQMAIIAPINIHAQVLWRSGWRWDIL